VRRLDEATIETVLVSIGPATRIGLARAACVPCRPEHAGRGPVPPSGPASRPGRFLEQSLRADGPVGEERAAVRLCPPGEERRLRCETNPEL